MTRKKCLDFSVEGPADAPVLVFIHGWPDDPSMWRQQLAVFSEKYCCVTVTLPNYGGTQSELGGLDFPEIVDRLHEVVLSVTGKEVILVTHDWGAYIGYLYEKQWPEYVFAMVAMDVGGHVSLKKVSWALMFVSYQWSLICFWLLGGLIPPLGTWLTRKFALLLRVPRRQASSLLSRCNYPYFYFWRANLVPWLRRRLLGLYVPKCKILYIYGGLKPLMFHSDRWLVLVEKVGGTSKCIDDASHWFMETHPAKTNQLIIDWFAENGI